jgi:hypothetical protein
MPARSRSQVAKLGARRPPHKEPHRLGSLSQCQFLRQYIILGNKVPQRWVRLIPIIFRPGGPHEGTFRNGVNNQRYGGFALRSSQTPSRILLKWLLIYRVLCWCRGVAGTLSQSEL